MTSLKGHCKSTRNYKTQVTNKTKQQNKAKQPQQTEKKNKHRKKKKPQNTSNSRGWRRQGASLEEAADEGEFSSCSACRTRACK